MRISLYTGCDRKTTYILNPNNKDTWYKNLKGKCVYILIFILNKYVS